jgi:uncharacterized protein YndB with AHSA1/START domain
MPICEVDPWPGSTIHIVMEAGETFGALQGTQWPRQGQFEEPSKIVFTANAVNEDKETLKHRTTVTFDEHNGKTKMTVHVAVTKILPGFEYAIVGLQQDWSQQFDKLERFLVAK